MKTKNLFAFLLTCLLSLTISSCESQEENTEDTTYSNTPAHVFERPDLVFTGKVTYASQSSATVYFDVLTDYTSDPDVKEALQSNNGHTWIKWAYMTDWPQALQAGDEFDFKIVGYTRGQYPKGDLGYHNSDHVITRYYLQPVD